MLIDLEEAENECRHAIVAECWQDVQAKQKKSAIQGLFPQTAKLKTAGYISLFAFFCIFVNFFTCDTYYVFLYFIVDIKVSQVKQTKDDTLKQWLQVFWIQTTHSTSRRFLIKRHKWHNERIA